MYAVNAQATAASLHKSRTVNVRTMSLH